MSDAGERRPTESHNVSLTVDHIERLHNAYPEARNITEAIKDSSMEGLRAREGQTGQDVVRDGGLGTVALRRDILVRLSECCERVTQYLEQRSEE